MRERETPVESKATLLHCQQVIFLVPRGSIPLDLTLLFRPSLDYRSPSVQSHLFSRTRVRARLV